MAGRPTIYTHELATQICDHLADGKSMVKACEAVGISRRTAALWLQTKPEFAEMTIHARGEWTDDLVDQLIDIAGNEQLDYNTRRLKIDAIKWVAGKQRPKKYSEKFLVEHGGEVDHKHTIAEMTDAELERIAKTSSSRTSEEEEG